MQDIFAEQETQRQSRATGVRAMRAANKSILGVPRTFDGQQARAI